MRYISYLRISHLDDPTRNMNNRKHLHFGLKNKNTKKRLTSTDWIPSFQYLDSLSSAAGSGLWRGRGQNLPWEWTRGSRSSGIVILSPSTVVQTHGAMTLRRPAANDGSLPVWPVRWEFWWSTMGGLRLYPSIFWMHTEGRWRRGGGEMVERWRRNRR